MTKRSLRRPDRTVIALWLFALSALLASVLLLVFAPLGADRWKIVTDFAVTAGIGGGVAALFKQWERNSANTRHEREREADAWAAKQAIVRDMFNRFCDVHSAYKLVRRDLRQAMESNSIEAAATDWLESAANRLMVAQLDCESLKHQCKPLQRVLQSRDDVLKDIVVAQASLRTIEHFLNDTVNELNAIRAKRARLEDSPNLKLFVGSGSHARAELRAVLFDHSDDARNALINLLVAPDLHNTESGTANV